MIVRRAIGSDFDPLLDLGKRMRSESVTDFPEIEEGKVALFLKASLDSPDTVMVYVAEDRGEIIGMITALISEYTFCYVKRSVCDMLFVIPERRGASAAKKLINKFVEWSGSAGVNDAIIGITTGVKPEATGRMFEKFGFDLIGYSYRMELGSV